MKKRIIVAKEDAEAIVAAINAGELKGVRAIAARLVNDGEADAAIAQSKAPVVTEEVIGDSTCPNHIASIPTIQKKGSSRTIRYRAAMLAAACLLLAVGAYVLVRFSLNGWKTQDEKNLVEFFAQVAKIDQALEAIEQNAESRGLQDRAKMERKELTRLKERIGVDANARIEALKNGNIEGADDLAVRIDHACNDYLKARSERLADLLTHYSELRKVYAVGNPKSLDFMRKFDLEEQQAISLCRNLESLTPALKRLAQ